VTSARMTRILAGEFVPKRVLNEKTGRLNWEPVRADKSRPGYRCAEGSLEGGSGERKDLSSAAAAP
jgi:hypothetical protein